MNAKALKYDELVLLEEELRQERLSRKPKGEQFKCTETEHHKTCGFTTTKRAEMVSHLRIEHAYPDEDALVSPRSIQIFE